jgi:hypothetical protein
VRERCSRISDEVPVSLGNPGMLRKHVEETC